MKRIHIVGCSSRTGTTLLTELMIRSFEIDLHTNHEDRIARCPPRNGNIYLTKSPKDIILIKPILKMVKNLHVICMLRDPRDIIVSKHQSNKHRYWSNLAYWFNYLPFFRELVDHPRFHVIKYELLVSLPDAVQNQIARQIPFLKKTNNFSDFPKDVKISEKSLDALGGVRSVNVHSIGNWKNHLPRVKNQMEKYGNLTDDLVEFGYETDGTWERKLKDVESDCSEEHFSDFYKKSWIKKKQRFKNLRAFKVWFFQTSLFLAVLEICYRIFRPKRGSQDFDYFRAS